MREKTSLADKYLLKHFYETCSQNSKDNIHCCGVELIDENYSWLDVVLDGYKKCGNCEFAIERQGFYYGKGCYSKNFEKQEYVSLENIKSQEEFEIVCEKINQNVKGITVSGAIMDASPFESFEKLEFVALSDQKIEHFWNICKNPNLRILSVYGNKHLKSLKGIEEAKRLECIQFLSSVSSINTVKIDSLKPLSKLPKLKEVILSATEPLDHNIDYLIELDQLEYLWISPNLFPIGCYAKFEAKKFMLSDEYGIYIEDGEDIFPYGKGKRVMHTKEQKQKYLLEYFKNMATYK